MEFGGYERGQIDDEWDNLQNEGKQMGTGCSEFFAVGPILLSEQLGSTQCMDVSQRMSVPDFQVAQNENYFTEQLDFNIDELFQDFDQSNWQKGGSPLQQFEPQIAPNQIQKKEKQNVNPDVLTSQSNQTIVEKLQNQMQQIQQQQQQQQQQTIKKFQYGCDRSLSVTSNDTLVVENSATPQTAQGESSNHSNPSQIQNCGDKSKADKISMEEKIQSINNIPFNPVSLGMGGGGVIPPLTFIPVQHIVGLPYQFMLPQLLQSGCFGKMMSMDNNMFLPLLNYQVQQQLLQQVQQQKQIPNFNKMQRQKKLERYRAKKMRRKALTKIRYPLRKANADQRPRIKGRFVRQNEYEKQSQKEEEEEEEDVVYDSMDGHSSAATHDQTTPPQKFVFQ